jgi:hypothetical protein
MPIDVIGFAIARAEADKRGLDTQESSRIGVIGAVMPNPIMALVVARSMAEREAPPPAASSTQGLPDIDITPPPKPPRDPVDPGGPGPGKDPTHAELIAHIDEAKADAKHAQATADGAAQAVKALSTKVDDGFKRIEHLLRPPYSSPLSAPMDPQQSTPGKVKGGGDKG